MSKPLVAFLLARIAEDEERAKGIEPGGDRQALARECDVKRRMVRICQEQSTERAARAEAALQALAAPYVREDANRLTTTIQSHRESA